MDDFFDKDGKIRSIKDRDKYYAKKDAEKAKKEAEAAEERARKAAEEARRARQRAEEAAEKIRLEEEYRQRLEAQVPAKKEAPKEKKKE